jgi:hypothetical protein
MQKVHRTTNSVPEERVGRWTPMATSAGNLGGAACGKLTLQRRPHCVEVEEGSGGGHVGELSQKDGVPAAGVCLRETHDRGQGR